MHCFPLGCCPTHMHCAVQELLRLTSPWQTTFSASGASWRDGEGQATLAPWHLQARKCLSECSVHVALCG